MRQRIPTIRVNGTRNQRRAAPRTNNPFEGEPMRAVKSAGVAIPWGRMFVSATFQGVDWFTLAKSAVGPEMARLVDTALKGIGQKIDEAVIADAKEAARNATTPKEAASDPTPGAAHVSEVKEVAATEPAQEQCKAHAPPEPVAVVDVEAMQAAELLGVSVGATQDEIRAALRRHLGSSGLHPDQGGDGEEAKRLIAAKNLLIERARAATQP